MKRLVFLIITILATAISCDNGSLDIESQEELVVEGWIEDGHAPVVMVSSTLPVTTEYQPLSNITEHILRYAEVYIESEGVRTDLTARLNDKFSIQNYFTSSTLRGEVGKSYTLHVKWQDYNATATCTIPESVPIDTMYLVKEKDDTSYVAKVEFTNEPSLCHYYQFFKRISDTTAFGAVSFSTMDGSKLDRKLTMTFMKTQTSMMKDCYLHPGEIIAIKLATTDETMYNYWSQFTNAYNTIGLETSPTNPKANIEGAIGYWAGYGVSVRELTVP